jgi:hypothetical protein
VTLAGASGQAFLTTHAPAILGSLPSSSVWRVRENLEPLLFEGIELQRLLHFDPEAFLAPTPVFCEGATEMGLLDELLPAIIGRNLDSSGIRLVDGQGQPNVLNIVDHFIRAEIKCAAFLDNETEHSGRRQRIATGCTEFNWQNAVNIENAVCKWLSLTDLFELIVIATKATKIEPRYLEDQVYQAIPETIQIGGPRDLRTAQYAEQVLRDAFYKAMNQKGWFKTRQGGQILALALRTLGIPNEINIQINDFGNRLQAILR